MVVLFTSIASALLLTMITVLSFNVTEGVHSMTSLQNALYAESAAEQFKAYILSAAADESSIGNAVSDFVPKPVNDKYSAEYTAGSVTSDENSIRITGCVIRVLTGDTTAAVLKFSAKIITDDLQAAEPDTALNEQNEVPVTEDEKNETFTFYDYDCSSVS